MCNAKNPKDLRKHSVCVSFLSPDTFLHLCTSVYMLYFLHQLCINLKLYQIQNAYYLKNFDRYPKICCKQGLFGWRALLMSLAQNEPLKNSKFHVCVKWMIKEENYHQQKGYLKNQIKDWWMSKVY